MSAVISHNWAGGGVTEVDGSASGENDELHMKRNS